MRRRAFDFTVFNVGTLKKKQDKEKFVLLFSTK